MISELNNIIKRRERHFDLKIPRLIAKEENMLTVVVWLRMMLSLILTGCTFKEYYNLNFIKRPLQNQKTFITTGSNIKAYKLLNDEAYNHIYINKAEFNEKYSDFISRDWIRLSHNREQIFSFFKRHDTIIIKPQNGDSGRGIKIIHNCDKLTDEEIDNLICDNEACIVEEVIYNHPKLDELNETSLNTMRVITVRNGDDMDILYAGIRFGAKGIPIDNISTGGRIAPLDLNSGKICGYTHTKKTVVISDGEADDHIGFQMPLWNELNVFLYRLTSVVPQMRYMAWDIAITEGGFAVIEGNHSSGNTIIQVHLDETQQGLRVRLNEIVARINRGLS